MAKGSGKGKSPMRMIGESPASFTARTMNLPASGGSLQSFAAKGKPVSKQSAKRRGARKR